MNSVMQTGVNREIMRNKTGPNMEIDNTLLDYYILSIPYKKAKTVYSISVIGNTEIPDIKQQIVLSILEIGKFFNLVCHIDDVRFHVASFYKESDAREALRDVMKKTMKNRFFYKQCWNCDEPVFYPACVCKTCDINMVLTPWKIITHGPDSQT